MRFSALHLLKFGGFTDHRLEFGDAPGRVHVVYGPNESGKSTTLRAIGDLFFGFPRTTQDDYLHDKKALRVGAVVIRDNGQKAELYRRKGDKRTLLDANGKELGSDPLEPLLSAVDRPTFERLFGLDHERLRRGGEELLRGGGSVALGLFQAGAGVASVRSVQAALEAEADELFRPRGSTQTINEGIRKLAEERTHVRQASVSAEAYHKLQQDLAEVELQIGAEETRVRELEGHRRQRERIRRNLGLLALRRDRHVEVEGLADVPQLSDDATERRLNAEGRRQRARAKLEQTSTRTQELEAERDAASVSPALLGAEGRLVRLQELLRSVAGAVRDLPKRETEETVVRQTVERLLRDARFDVPVAAAEQALPRAPDAQAVRRVADERESLDARLTELRGRLLELEGEHAAKARELGQLPVVADPSPLERAIKEARSLGFVEEAIEKLARASERQSADLDRDLRALPQYRGDLEGLRQLTVPLDATVQRFAKLWQDQAAALETARRRQHEAREATDHQRQELESIEREGELPTETAISAARRRRDEGWSLVRRAYVDASADVTAEARAYDAERRLPQAYEAAVAHADRLADRRQAETARVTRFEQGKARLEQCEAREREARNHLESAERDRDTLEQDWAAQWEGLEAAPLAPLEMRDWIRERRAVLTRAEDLEIKRAEEQDARTKLVRAREALSRALSQFDVNQTANASLPELIEAAEARAHALRTSVERARNLREALSQLEARRETLNVRIGDTERELESWAAKWQAALRGLGRSGDSHPVEIRALLDVIEELRLALSRWRELDQRVRAMRADRQALEVAVNDLRAELAPELGHQGVLDVAECLVAMLEGAKKTRNRQEHLSRELERASRESTAAREELEDAESELALLCAQAGCERPEQLEAIEAKVRRKGRAQQELRGVERDLLAGGDGLSLDELVREADGAEAEVLLAELGRIEADIGDARERVKPLIERRTELRHQLSTMSGADAAAAGAQRAEGLVAGLREDVEQWLTLKVALDLLRRGLERYRERNQGPLIGRASEHFQRLTLGRYAKLAVDYDAQDRPVIEGVLAEGRQVTIEGMSDGTRDQLYLALRLAVLERLTSKGEAVPATFDDVLVHFDDERSGAALRGLSDLAQHTQVLYFTHHRRVVELAQQQIEAGRLMIHTLPG